MWAYSENLWPFSFKFRTCYTARSSTQDFPFCPTIVESVSSSYVFHAPSSHLADLQPCNHPSVHFVTIFNFSFRFPIVEPDPGHTKLRISREGLEAIERIQNPIAAVAVRLRSNFLNICFCHLTISIGYLPFCDRALCRSER